MWPWSNTVFLIIFQLIIFILLSGQPHTWQTVRKYIYIKKPNKTKLSIRKHPNQVPFYHTLPIHASNFYVCLELKVTLTDDNTYCTDNHSENYRMAQIASINFIYSQSHYIIRHWSECDRAIYANLVLNGGLYVYKYEGWPRAKSHRKSVLSVRIYFRLGP